MENKSNPILIEFRKTDKPTPSVRIVAAFLVLVFALIPLEEIVPDFEYNTISSHSTHFCISDLDYFFEPVTFKEVR